MKRFDYYSQIDWKELVRVTELKRDKKKGLDSVYSRKAVRMESLKKKM